MIDLNINRREGDINRKEGESPTVLSVTPPSLEPTFKNDDKSERQKLQDRIKELETVNRALAEKVSYYENMNVVQTIISLTKKYDELTQKLKETEEKIKKANEFLGTDGNPGLNGNFAQKLEQMMKDAKDGKTIDTGDIPVPSKNVGDVVSTMISSFMGSGKNIQQIQSENK